MTDDIPVTPIRGYQKPSKEALAAVNENKELEELVLQRLDDLDGLELSIDKRFQALARTHIETAFMFMNRAILQPKRISLPED